MASPRKRVLVVDDDFAIRRLIALTLRDAVDLVDAADGRQAIEILDGEAPFDCVILDLTMPGASGLEVVRSMRSNPALAGVAVLILTAHDSRDIPPDLLGGAVTLLNKPFERRKLRSLVFELTGVETCGGDAAPHRSA